MIQVCKEDILKTRDGVRCDAIKMLTRDINNELQDWIQQEKEGKKRDEVYVTIPTVLEGNLPEELRTELESVGYKCEVKGGVLTIS